LPAQYGYRTAGIVDIQTKSGAFDPGGRVGLTSGTNGTWQPSAQYGGNAGALNYFVTGDFLSSEQGIEGPTSSMRPLHDDTQQGKGFGYFSYLLNPTNRLNVVLGSSVSEYQVPNNPGQQPSYDLTGASVVPSAQLNENQREENHYATVALQGTNGDFDYQLAPYARYSLLHFTPDAVGDLQYNGVASNVERTDVALGLQGDGSYRVNESHTLRSGFVTQHEKANADNSSSVFPATLNADGSYTQTSNAPQTIVDDNSKTGMLYGVYLQDEWKLTPKLTMNYGARFDAVNAYVDETQLSPRLGFVYEATSATTLHAGYARYFTPPPMELVAPGSVAKFANTTNQPAVGTDDPVRSERSNSFDVGVSHKLTDKVTLGWDNYYKQVHDLLDEGQFGQALVLTPFNYAQGRIYGSEVTASYTGKTVSAYANFAVSSAMGKDIISSQESFTDPSELAYISNHWVHLDHDQTYTASAGASYQILRDTRVGLDGVLGSGLRDGFANTGHLPLYAAVNAVATQHLDVGGDKGVDLRFTVINLFNSDYELRNGTGIGVGAPQWGPRIGFLAGLSKAF